MPSAPSAEVFQRLFSQYLWAGIAIGALVLLYLAVAILRHRRGGAAPADAPRAGEPDAERGSPKVALLLSVGIALVLFPLSFANLGAHKDLEHPPAGEHLEVGVTAFRFGWLFQYPEGFQTLNELRVPIGVPIVLDIEAQDVMHKFHIADYHVGIDAMPGRMTHAWFQADDEAPTEIRCAELCGPGHALMVAKVIPVSPDAYAAWNSEQVAAASSFHQDIEVRLTEEGVEAPGARAMTDVPLLLRIENGAASARGLAVTGVLTGESEAVAAGTLGLLSLDAPAAGEITLQAVDGSGAPVGEAVTLTVQAPLRVAAELSEFKVLLDASIAPAGGPVLFAVRNAGTMPHDLAVGDWEDGKALRVEAQTRPLAAGESALLPWWPTGSGAVDAWCTVPGHASLGMIAQLEVSA